MWGGSGEFGVAAGEMSVGGSTLVSVISPGAAACASSEPGDAPLALRKLPDDKPGQVGLSAAEPTGIAPSEMGLVRQEPGGRQRGQSEHDRERVNRRRLNGAALAGAAGLGRRWLNGAELDGEVGQAEAELSRVEFVVVDLETTGWSPGAAAITEIGAVRVRAGRRVGETVRQGEFASLVNPGVPMPPRIADLTRITDWMLAAAPRLGTVLPGLLDFAGGCVLVAHNAPFDLGFLVAGCDDCGLAWPGFNVLDTVMLARHVMDPDEVPDCKLGTLAGFFGARTAPSHRALSDARATADVLGWLIRRLAHRGIRTLGQLSMWPDVLTSSPA
jgi:DNA polymerase III epsilon subunit family exonuclease